MDFKQLKFKSSELGYLMADPTKGMTPTALQLEKALMAFGRDNHLALTDSQCRDIMTVLTKYALYSPEKLPAYAKEYLYSIYAQQEYGIDKIYLFPEGKTRFFQINGTRSEKFAIDILSVIDGVPYEKNRAYYENDFFVGKPDIITPTDVKEIKCVTNLCNFIQIGMSKDTKHHQFQLQSYFDLVERESGEIIYVLVGLNGTERDRYIEHAKQTYLSEGYSDREIGKKLQEIEKNCDFDHFPHEKRVIRRTFKKNPYMIRLARKKVTAARAFLAKIDAKFSKSVVLLNDASSSENKDV